MPPLAAIGRRGDDDGGAPERQVLTLVAGGAADRDIADRDIADRDIADRLGVAEATVNTYLTRVFGKLGVDDRTAAVTVALARRLIRLD